MKRNKYGFAIRGLIKFGSLHFQKFHLVNNFMHQLCNTGPSIQPLRPSKQVRQHNWTVIGV